MLDSLDFAEKVMNCLFVFSIRNSPINKAKKAPLVIKAFGANRKGITSFRVVDPHQSIVSC